MPAKPSLFRSEALAALETTSKPGAPLDITPHWVGRVYWLVLAAVSVGLSYLISASAGEYAEGPAVVRIEGRLDLATPTGGIIRTVEVQAGDRVKKGQILIHFQTTAEQQELEHINSEFELKLAAVLVNPGDETARQSLTSLRAARELAEARLEERSVIAPRNGVVANLRIRPGQSLAPGEVVATLVNEDGAVYSVVALVPGQFRPMLKQGLKMRFSLEGFPHAYATIPIDSVGDEVVGPNEARRYLGQELGDTLDIAGSLVLVRARLPTATFVFEDKSYRYHDGIPGKVDVRVRSMPLLVMLFSAFKGLFGDAL